ncbi:MAG: Gldg family protein [Alphaproteobacteria bacterium]|nr:Gldg family protein [Alphaproteobacteria bacterium]
MTPAAAARRLLGWTGVALALGFAVRTALLGQVDDRGRLLALLAAAVLALVAWVERDAVEDAARSPSARARATATMLTLAAGVVAVLAHAVVREVDDTVDLGRRAHHTLGSHTLGVLDGLDAPVRVTAFFPRTSPLRPGVASLLQRYAERSDRVEVHLVDPLAAPLEARRLGATSEAGELVLTSGDRLERVLGRFDEDAVTDALVRLVSPEDHVICWSIGHEEADPDDTRSPGGAGSLVTALEGLDAQVLRADLAQPLDPACEALVLAGPRIDLLPAERTRLLGWVAGGGRALVLLEPGLASGLASDLAAMGVRVGEEVVLDGDPRHSPLGAEDPSLLVVPPGDLGDHPITRGLRGAVLASVARPVDVRPTPGADATVLLRAGPSSWAERDPLGDAPAPDGDEARGGMPLGVAVEVVGAAELLLPEGPSPAPAAATLLADTLAAVGLPPDLPVDRPLTSLGLPDAAVQGLTEVLRLRSGVPLVPRARGTLADLRDALEEGLARRAADVVPPEPTAPRDGGRLVVLGDAGLIGNGSISLGSNQDLLLNALAWLVGAEDQLGERADDLGDDLLLTAQGRSLIALIALGLLPGLALAGAVWSWRTRAA